MSDHLLLAIFQATYESKQSIEDLRKDVRHLRREVKALKGLKPSFDLRYWLDHWLVKLAAIAALLAANMELKDILRVIMG